ncbi:MAG: glycosyltransferase family 4 protein [Vicinamibacteria bacterium]|jgi:glycosyltransferase involved in cell wall biosynthesis|nr:glycosyltransferase family 4 protein [Vicinamibacteria bacterium]
MKILYLAADSLAQQKGAAVRIRQTIATLRNLGHEVELFTPDEMRAQASEHSPESRSENYLARMLAWRQAAHGWLASRSADLVQFRGIWEGAPAVAWAEKAGARAIFEMHGLPSIELPYHYPRLAERPRMIEKLIAEERWVLGRVQHVIVPSRVNARCLLRVGVPSERCSIVPNAVDLNVFTPAPIAPADALPLRLVYVGTLSPWQGLETLIEAMARVRSRLSVELHVIGPLKSLWRTELRRLARGLRLQAQVHLNGPMEQADLLPVLHTAHVCVAPLPADPRNEVQGCCPIKLLEYMAAARPILATRIAPVREILEHGLTAHLVRPSSPTALAEGLLHLAAHPAEREALGAAARRIVEERYTARHFEGHLRDALVRAVGPRVDRASQM